MNLTNNEKSMVLNQLKALQGWLELEAGMDCLDTIGSAFEDLIIALEDFETTEVEDWRGEEE